MSVLVNDLGFVRESAKDQEHVSLNLDSLLVLYVHIIIMVTPCK